MTFQVDGVDLTPYIASGGIQWTRNDVDGTNAGRAMDATMYRDRVAIKFKFTITCRPLTMSEAATVLSAIEPEYVSVTYTNPMTGSDTTGEAYSNNVPATYLFKDKSGTEWWTGITFPLIER